MAVGNCPQSTCVLLHSGQWKFAMDVLESMKSGHYRPIDYLCNLFSEDKEFDVSFPRTVQKQQQKVRERKTKAKPKNKMKERKEKSNLYCIWGHGKAQKQKLWCSLTCFNYSYWKPQPVFQSPVFTLAGFKWYALGSFCKNEIIMPGMGLEKHSHNKRPCQVFLISFLEAKSHETTTRIPKSDSTCLSNQCHFGQNVPKSWEYPGSWIYCRNAMSLAGLLILVLVCSLETVNVFFLMILLDSQRCHLQWLLSYSVVKSSGVDSPKMLYSCIAYSIPEITCLFSVFPTSL